MSDRDSQPAVEAPASGQSPGTTLVVYNTLSRRKEAFEPLEAGRVRMYNCGPTVYNYFHVGNARNFVCADVIRRYLSYRGYEVTFVQNITDVDDKIIAKAAEEGVDSNEIAERYTRIFFECSEKLGVRPADHHPRATKYVGKMVGFVKRLVDEGYAYESGGDVFFRVERFNGYGKLSGRRLDELLSGARVEVSDKKENPADFTLWKASKAGEPSWPSPWGRGRPGWHLECSVMSTDLLGDSFDVHMGGSDLVFPHHENEIAQSEAATGKPFVKYWLHNNFLNIDGEKMSKSLGNFFTIDEVLQKFEAAAVRYFLLSAHYRAPLDFSDVALAEATTALGRLREAFHTAREVAGDTAFAVERYKVNESVDRVQSAFVAAMDDDFNTPRALAALFDAATEINRLYNRNLKAQQGGGALDEADRAEAALLAELLEELGGGVLGLDLEMPGGAEIGVEDLSGELIQVLIDVRAAARQEKAWALADMIRDRLGDLGFQLKDLPTGTRWERRH